MSKKLLIEIVTPSSVIYQGEADSINLPGSKSPFEVLYNHAAIVSSLDLGIIKIKNSNSEIGFKTSTGFAEVNNNKVSVLVEEANQI